MLLICIPNNYRIIVDKYMQQAPVDVRAIAAQIPIPIYERAIHGSGYLLSVGDGDYQIYINNAEHETRKRFTIAHELAHFFLHAPTMHEGHLKPRGMLNGYMSSEERDANNLAAEILMPYELLKRVTKEERIDSVEKLAARFEVSVQAMQIRLGIPQ